jgi:fibronectin type 3 domain-containing protein
MRNCIHFTPGLRGFCLVSFVALSLVAGCGKKISGDTQKPAEPANPHSVTISWTASPSPVAGYNVYRSSGPSKPVRLTNGIVSGTQYTDRTVEAGKTYSYYVTSVDSKGAESQPSSKITATVPTTVTPPAKQ